MASLVVHMMPAAERCLRTDGVPSSCACRTSQQSTVGSNADAETQQEHAQASRPAGPSTPVVDEAAYAALPSFCRSQLSYDQLSEGLAGLARGCCRQSLNTEPHFKLEDLEQLGLTAAKSKVFVNCLVKLGHAELRSASGGLTYILKGQDGV